MKIPVSTWRILLKNTAKKSANLSPSKELCDSFSIPPLFSSAIFLLVVVVGPPAFSFFFQQAWQKLQVWHQAVLHAAGWLWRLPQAVQYKIVATGFAWQLSVCAEGIGLAVFGFCCSASLPLPLYID
jgi:hypothetical protein